MIGTDRYVVGYHRSPSTNSRNRDLAVHHAVAERYLSGTRGRAFDALCTRPGNWREADAMVVRELPPGAHLCRTCRALLAHRPPPRLAALRITIDAGVVLPIGDATS